jgi:hypothetical protein
MADPDYTALGYQRVGNFRAMETLSPSKWDRKPS